VTSIAPVGVGTVDPGGDPIARLIKKERKRNLEAALARLTEDDRMILTRYYLLQEGTQIKIAEAMGIPVATFNNRLNHARKRLKREILRGPDGEDGAGYDPY
jgi:RNA polymerase sigma factor (sigma-70 family)